MTPSFRRLVVANWKMNQSLAEASSYSGRFVDAMRKVGGRLDAVDVGFGPAFVHLPAVKQAVAGTGVKLVAQTCHDAAKGAFTGEVAAVMLRELDVSYVIAGHSERRHLMGETDVLVGRKVEAILAAGLTPIVCVGETLAERERDQTNAVVTAQLEKALAGSAGRDESDLVVAYEPVWAIGTGRKASTQAIEDAIATIRAVLGGLRASWRRARVLYGGSVGSENAAELFDSAAIDGALIGSASLDPVAMATMVDCAARCGDVRK